MDLFACASAWISRSKSAAGFATASACQAEYFRNLLFRSGAQVEALFDRILDRTRSRPDIPVLRTIFCLKTRPHGTRKDGPRRRRS